MNVGGGAVLLQPLGRKHTGITVLIIHGVGSDRFYGLWYLIAFLLDRGYSVMTANLPGHGVGGREKFSLEAARHRLDQMIASAGAHSDESRIILLGQSLGASLAIDAVLRGAVVGGVVAVSSIVQLRVHWSMLRELGTLGSNVARSLEFDRFERIVPAVGPFGKKRFPIRIADDASYVDKFSSVIRTLRLVDRIRRAKNHPPVLIVHGEKDGIVPVSQAECLGRALGVSPIIVSGAHHLDLLWNQNVVKRIEQWIRLNATREDGKG